jgi:hypothetical protein
MDPFYNCTNSGPLVENCAATQKEMGEKTGKKTGTLCRHTHCKNHMTGVPA